MGKNITNGFEKIHDLIKLRWVPEILKSLNQGNQHYSDILASIPYLSHTELNRKLALLIDKDVICKQTSDKIYYSLLEFGEDLIHIFEHLKDLQEKYFIGAESSE